MRYALLGIAFAACTAAFAGGKHVDLDDAGKLDAIRRDDPARYQKIVQAIDAAQVTSCEDLPHMLKTKLDIFDTHCSPYALLTSFPPK